MLRFFYLSFLGLSFALWSCQGRVAQDFNQGRERANANPGTANPALVKGEIHSKTTYCYYFPSSLTETQPAPILIFFDPEGEGSEPLEKYRGIADSLGIILIGSLETKNGLSFEQTRLITARLLEVARRDFMLKQPAVYLVGFSGGAKVALDAAMHFDSVNGAIYCGAPGRVEQISKPVMGFVGNRDMNFADCLHFEASLADSIPHALITWGGKHEWPPASLFIRSMYWVLYSPTASQPSPSARQYYNKILADFNATKDPMKQAETLHELWLLAQNSPHEKEARQTLQELLKSPAYRKSEAHLETSLQMELEAKSRYNNAFFEKDLDWWEKEIKSLQHKNSASSQRMMAYFSLAGYSLAHRALAQEQLDFLEKVLTIYEMADPDNAEVYYLKAVYFAKLNRPNEVELALQHARSRGFSDKSRAAQQTEFKALVSENTLVRLFCN